MTVRKALKASEIFNVNTKKGYGMWKVKEPGVFKKVIEEPYPYKNPYPEPPPYVEPPYHPFIPGKELEEKVAEANAKRALAEYELIKEKLRVKELEAKIASIKDEFSL